MNADGGTLITVPSFINVESDGFLFCKTSKHIEIFSIQTLAILYIDLTSWIFSEAFFDDIFVLTMPFLKQICFQFKFQIFHLIPFASQTID